MKIRWLVFNLDIFRRLVTGELAISDLTDIPAGLTLVLVGEANPGRNEIRILAMAPDWEIWDPVSGAAPPEQTIAVA